MTNQRDERITRWEAEYSVRSDSDAWVVCALIRELREAQQRELAVIACIERAETAIERKDRTLDDWLAQILQALVMDASNAPRCPRRRPR